MSIFIVSVLCPSSPPPRLLRLISIDEVFYGACLRDFLIGSVIVIEGRFFWRVFYSKYQSNTQGEKNKAINHWLVVFLTVTESWSTCNAYQQPLLIHWSVVQYCFLISFCCFVYSEDVFSSYACNSLNHKGIKHHPGDIVEAGCLAVSMYTKCFLK